MNSAQCNAINKKALVAGSVNTGTEGGWGEVGGDVCSQSHAEDDGVSGSGS